MCLLCMIYIYITFPQSLVNFPFHLLKARSSFALQTSPNCSFTVQFMPQKELRWQSHQCTFTAFFFHGDAMEIYHGIKMGLYGENNHTEISISSCVRENLQEIQSVSHQIWEVPAFFNKLLGTIITWNWNMKRFEWLSGEAVFGALYIHLFWP